MAFPVFTNVIPLILMGEIINGRWSALNVCLLTAMTTDAKETGENETNGLTSTLCLMLISRLPSIDQSRRVVTRKGDGDGRR